MSTETNVRELAALALAAYDEGAPERASVHLQEAVSLLAECANVDATELLDVLQQFAGAGR